MRDLAFSVPAILLLTVGAALAQPAGAPPDGAASYTDDSGCQWQRVEIGESVAWAAVIGANGAQLCDGPQVAGASASAPPTTSTGRSATDDAKSAGAGQPAASPTVATTPGRPVRDASWRKSKRRPVFPEPGHYLQVGAFAEPDNASRTIARMHGLGYDVLKQDFPHRGGTLRVLYAGPFPDAGSAEAARRNMRSEGFTDAFVWAQD